MSAPQYRKVAALALVAGLGLSLAACSTKSSSDNSKDASGKTVITIDCQPDGSQKDLQKDWNDDVAAFEAANPSITIKSVSVGQQCDNPPDFTARLTGGTETDLFYAYMTDVQQVLDSGQAMDLTPYANKDNIPTWGDIDAQSKAIFQDGGKQYAIPTKNYSMGLLINKTLFTKAGLDPSKPPTTWADVAADAKKISAAVPGVAGYGDYSAGNTGGWHFTAELYSQGGEMVTADGKKADFNNAMGQQVLTNLKTMRYTNNSMGTRQLLQWGDLLTLAAANKVGMLIGAPDVTTAIVQTFKGKYEDWAMGPMPGQDGPAKGTLGGGEGYFFRKDLTPDQVKAGLKWLAFEKLTPGKGQFDYARAKPQNQPVGLPEPQLFTAGTPSNTQDTQLKTANSNVPADNFTNFVSNPVPVKVEPPNAQAIYAVLDSSMSAVLTKPDANVNDLLKTAETKVNQLLAQGS